MATKKKGLGRGLEALLGPNATQAFVEFAQEMVERVKTL